MQQLFLLKRFLCGFLIVLQCNLLRASDPQSEETIENGAKETVDWTGLLSDLRDSWQSPLYYLEKRGYLPPVNENLLEQKVNELRAMKVDEQSVADSGEKLDESVEDLPNAVDEVSAELKTNDNKQTNALSSSAVTGGLNTAEVANENPAIITIASQQQPQAGVEEALLKELLIDAQPEAEANVASAAGTDTETDPDTEEDFSSVKNNVANVCRKKIVSPSGSKSKLILKCRPKSKSKTHTKLKSKPGFFERLKDKISSIFKKPTTEMERKDPQIKSKPALSPDYANYYVKYLAHRDMNADTNNLNVKDLDNEYARIKSNGNIERGDRGLHRQEYSDKQGYVTKVSTSSELIDKADTLQSLTDNEFSATNLDSAAAAVERKDIILNEFPFRDFNFADVSAKKISTKEVKQSNKPIEKLTDLETFNSKDEELNKIVHSLAEQQSGEKDAWNKVNMNSETKDDFEFKDSTIPKDVGNELQDNTKLFQKEHKDFGAQDFEPSIDMESIAAAPKHTEGEKVASKHNEFEYDFSMPSCATKNVGPHTNADTINKATLGSINDGDLSIPALDFKPCSSHAKVGAVKDVPGVRDYGNLGMSQLKMRILESNVEDFLPFNGEYEEDSNELSAIRYDTPYRTDFDIKSNDDHSKSYATRELVEKPSVNKPNSAVDLSNQLAVEQTNFNGFQIGDPLTIMDETNLDLDRQFTRQVLEKVMRSTAKKREHDYG
ncbi:uncharacterized protein LOC105664699 [Ceratitis capitata]|uniref:uncharacterized protein LOC105664699 n=1 Tax=Ceratitis capitata TaxID=7213 RepID=UPI0006188FA7|nr:uncharacterized protein LOC105664699 [Ceratitis capitata]